jgi:hypothetical protein
MPPGLWAQVKMRRDRGFKRECKLAVKGDSSAVRKIVGRYMNNGETGYYEKSLHTLMPACANGSPEACYVLGNCLFRRSRDSSIYYYTAGVHTGAKRYGALCSFALGDLYARGLPPELMGGVSTIRDTAKAIYWYQQFLTYDVPYIDKVNIHAKILIYTSGGNAALHYLDSVIATRNEDEQLKGLRGPIVAEISGYR